MKEIDNSSEKISKVVRVIDEIAFQTNILALNAAVEAARAGEAAMGFGVVAEEVRSMAHRSAQAAEDVASLIEESIGRSREGGRNLELVAQSIQQITHSAKQVKALANDVAAGGQNLRGIGHGTAALVGERRESASGQAHLRAARTDEEPVSNATRDLAALGKALAGHAGSAVKPAMVPVRKASPLDPNEN